MSACVKCKSARVRWSLSQARNLIILDTAIAPQTIIAAGREWEARTVAVREGAARRSIPESRSPLDSHTTEEIL